MSPHANTTRMQLTSENKDSNKKPQLSNADIDLGMGKISNRLLSDVDMGSGITVNPSM